MAAALREKYGARVRESARDSQGNRSASVGELERGERAARACLRGQVAHLERQLGALAASTYPRIEMEPLAAGLCGPRVLGVGDLECLRDELVGRLTTLRSLTADQVAEQRRRRALLDAVRADPGSHRWLRIANAEVGVPGCTVYESRPRLGLLGMLMGWWRVKVSSGCP